MGLLDTFRFKVEELILKNELRQVRDKEFHNFDSAKSIGILFNAAEEYTYRKSKEFINQVQRFNVDVKALGYVYSQEAIPLYPYSKEIEFFAIRNFNWYKKPTDESITKFCNRDFDIFINLSLEERLQTNYIVAASNAKFKIGATCKSNMYDLYLCTQTEKPDLDTFIKQVMHYMTIIKKPQ